MIQLIPQVLKANTEVAAITDRIKPVGTNQDDALPYVTFQVISDMPTRCRGGIASEAVRVQVTAYSETYGQKEALYQAIRKALDRASNAGCECEWLTAHDLYHEEGLAHGKAIDFQLLTR